MKSALDSLLSLKRWEEDEAKNLFVLAKKELESEEARLESLETDFAAISRSIKEDEKKAVTIEKMGQAHRHLEHLVSLLQRQKKVIAKSEKRLEEARIIMAGASLERKIYEKVEDKHKEEERHEALKKEERDMDEHAVIRYKRTGEQ
jgi:flagellar protein FliJ